MEDNDKDKLGDKAVQAGGGSGSSGGGNGGGEGWPALLMECVLQAWPELNATHSLPVPSHTLSNTSHTFFFDHDFYRRLLNLSESGELNGTEAGGLSRERLEQCLAPPPADRPYLLPWWQQLTWTLAFGAMLLVAVGGNAIVMWIVIAHRRMRTVTNYFLVNLSAADLLMAIFNCIFNFIYMLHSDWPFGAVYCTISNFMANVTIAASVFTLMAISFDRYIAIVRPLKPRMSKSEARHFIIFIWLSSMSLAVPCLLYSTTVSIKYKNDEIRRGCFLLWPDGQTSISYREYVYNIVFFATTYVLPMLVMLVSYTLISCELWGSHSIGELTDRQASSIKSKRRVVRMFIVIVVAFMLCWLPQQGFFLYQYHNSQVLDSAHIQHIYLGFYWLAMANAMVNPIIYYWMNARFRSYFREVVLQCSSGRCCCCCSTPSTYLDSPHLTRRRQDSIEHTSRSRSAGGVTPRFCTKAGGNQHHDNFFIRGMNCSKPLDAAYCHGHLKANTEWHQMHYLSDKGNFSFQKQVDPLYAHNLNGVRKPQNDDTLLSQQLRGEDAWKTPCEPALPHLPPEKHDDLLLVPVLASPPLRLPHTTPLLNSNHVPRENLTPKRHAPKDNCIEMKCLSRENNHITPPRILLNANANSTREQERVSEPHVGPGEDHTPAGLVHQAIEETLMAAMLQSCPCDQTVLDTSKKCEDTTSIKMSKEIML
ncbi:tachykinin-like peptides receptor 86C isoform X2 [Portunus trituberculatus]|uniref:tachykinin-like peptides receptor 86C isoform X2 n=1 Tax=Portunus trituberculatus TaxID=210409 RepID=UPI001E1CC5E0|nr:tachykinin-like peptides receptor 86C isoform X2 [Portunus trituberculatus]